VQHVTHTFNDTNGHSWSCIGQTEGASCIWCMQWWSKSRANYCRIWLKREWILQKKKDQSSLDLAFLIIDISSLRCFFRMRSCSFLCTEYALLMAVFVFAFFMAALNFLWITFTSAVYVAMRKRRQWGYLTDEDVCQMTRLSVRQKNQSFNLKHHPVAIGTVHVIGRILRCQRHVAFLAVPRRHCSCKIRARYCTMTVKITVKRTKRKDTCRRLSTLKFIEFIKKEQTHTRERISCFCHIFIPCFPEDSSIILWLCMKKLQAKTKLLQDLKYFSKHFRQSTEQIHRHAYHR